MVGQCEAHHQLLRRQVPQREGEGLFRDGVVEVDQVHVVHHLAHVV